MLDQLSLGVLGRKKVNLLTETRLKGQPRMWSMWFLCKESSSWFYDTFIVLELLARVIIRSGQEILCQKKLRLRDV